MLSSGSAAQPAHSLQGANTQERAHISSDVSAAAGQSAGEAAPRTVIPTCATFEIHDSDVGSNGSLDDGYKTDFLNLPPASAGKRIWHQYVDPKTNEVWFSCTTDPNLWVFAREVKNFCSCTTWCCHKETDVSCGQCTDHEFLFEFQKQWQKVGYPPTDATNADSCEFDSPH